MDHQKPMEEISAVDDDFDDEDTDNDDDPPAGERSLHACSGRDNVQTPHGGPLAQVQP